MLGALKGLLQGLLAGRSGVLPEQERLQLLAEATEEGILIHRGGLVLDANERLAAMFGYRRRDILGRRVQDLISPEAWERIAHALATGDGEMRYEVDGVHRDGTPYTVEVHSRPIRYGGAPARVGLIRDITARKRAERALARSERDLRGILDNMQDTFYRTDRDGCLVMVSPSVEQLLGYRPDELLGRRLADLYVDPRGRERFLAALQAAGGRIAHYEAALWSKDRRQVWVSTHAHFHYDDRGAVAGVEGTVRDITAYKEAQSQLLQAKRAAEEANRAKSRFLATMSHEMRTPLNGVLGMVQVLKRTPLDSRQKRYVETIDESANMLLALIGDVLDLARIEAGRLDLASAPFAPRRLAERLLPLLQEQAAAKGLRLAAELDPRLPPQVRGDAVRLRQVLLNLLGNAVKFTDEGQVLLRVEVAEGDGQKVRLRFAVEDTGPGIPEAQRDRLFRPFELGDDSSTRRHGGAGLGLAISRQLVEAMGGRLELQSEPGQGCRFRFELDFPLGVDEAEAPGEAPPPSADRPRRVLLAEDLEINRRVIEAMLEDHGHRVTAVADGRQALEAVQRERYDLVLMDVQMPVLDGEQAARRIRALEAQGAPRTPIVGLTANALPEDTRRYLEAGMDAVLVKPVEEARLLAVLRDLSA